MRKINPSCKLIGLLILTLATAFVHHPLWNLALFAASVILILLSGCRVKTFLIPLIPVLLLAVGIVILLYRKQLNIWAVLGASGFLLIPAVAGSMDFGIVMTNMLLSFVK